jgi:hypothetical protein
MSCATIEQGEEMEDGEEERRENKLKNEME